MALIPALTIPGILLFLFEKLRGNIRRSNLQRKPLGIENIDRHTLRSTLLLKMVRHS